MNSVLRQRLRAAPAALFSMLIVLLLLAPAAWYRHGRLLGWAPAAEPQAEEAAALSAARQVFAEAAALVSASPGWVIRDRQGKLLGHVISSRSAAPAVRGFGGPLEVRIYAGPDGAIRQVQLGQHSEDPAFVQKVSASGLLQSWDGRPLLAPAEESGVDAVAGATYTSTAIVEAVTAIRQDQNAAVAASDKDAVPVSLRRRLAPFIGLYCLGQTLILAWPPPRPRRRRQLQLLMNTLVLGGVCGAFLSLSHFLGWLAAGTLAGGNLLSAGLLLAAVLMPLLTGRPFYCRHLCPLGSAQELLGTFSARKWPLGPRWQRFARWSRGGVVFLLLLLWSGGVGLQLTRFELFPALIWGVADYPLLAAAALFGALSLFVPRPYCRFVCPTGWLIAYCDSRQSSTPSPPRSPSA